MARKLPRMGMARFEGQAMKRCQQRRLGRNRNYRNTGNKLRVEEREVGGMG